MPNSSNLKAVTGANILFCGHKGWFVADIHVVGNNYVVVANGPVSTASAPKHRKKDDPTVYLIRDNVERCVTHHISEDYGRCYWGMRRGVFVLAAGAVREITDANRREFF